MEQLERSALGLLSPCSHCLTVEEVVFRYLANTDWLSLIRSRIFLICSEDNLSTGGKHSASNSRMVVASIMPASYNPFAISCATFSMNDFSAFFSVFMQSSLSILHDQLSKQAVKSFILKVAHEMAKGLYDAGIMDATTMREFDALCLPPVERLSSEQIKKIRLRIRLSQSVFAKYLNTTSSTVKQWEQGDKSPRALLSSCSILSQKRP